ncbi:CAP domain-containing protein [Cryptosporangium minutisporangium]|uniref:SCP domain-containing protein n=1 Tax=Cryptosporangium minutisporangium TaxID=113569 RepID=A0ABP6T344_9ACTN
MSEPAFPRTRSTRPDLYAGARRRFSGLGTIASGFVALVLVLGALLTSELDRYSSQDSPPLHSQATGSPGLPTNGAVPGGSPAPAAPGGTAAPERTSSAPSPSSSTAVDEVNRAVVATVNRSLDDLGCESVAIEPRLVAAARAHMDTMVETGYLTVTGPDGDNPKSRAKAAGFTGSTVVQAIVLGAETPTDAATLGAPPPAAADDALPITVRVVAKTPLKCGYTSLGADFRRDSRNVPIAAIVLAKK